MADHCTFCDTRRPLGGTQILVLNGGSFWAEFCPECGETETLTNADTGETIAELFRRCGGEPKPAPGQAGRASGAASTARRS